MHGFQVTEVKDVAELQLTAVRLKHSVTGADYLHIAKDDPNNVFSIGFRTTPMDSTGVPHILEHTVLCGSQKYPVRDPFFKMLNRSLSTFMNAMTGNDFTVYPFSTQNPIDFRNLMSVYLDAVFRPNLSELDFNQEGWRLEHADPNDSTSPLQFKGVVFNEMKGVFADSQNLFLQKLQNGVLPSHTYGVVSGGYPLDIPNLTWDALKSFHTHHYHPSNSRIYSYGNQDLVSHLEFINENYLKSFSKIDPNTEVPEEPRWSSPVSDHIHCGVDALSPGSAQNSVAVSYLLTDITDMFEIFVLQVLSELLVSGPNAPFYKSLLEKQYGNSFIPGAGYSGDTRTTTFNIGLRGVEESQIENVLLAVENTFHEARNEGFPMERVEAILHGLELGLKHQSSSFGLGVVLSLSTVWNQDGDPIKALEINNVVTKLRKALEDNPRLFQDKIDQYFIKNKHKYTLTMSPKEDFEQALKDREQELLQKHIASLTDADRAKIFEMGLTLASKQNSTENLDCLPTLKTSDISRSIESTTITHNNICGVAVQVCPQPTNDVAYFHAILDAQDVPENLMSYVPLLCSIMTKMGAGDLNFRDFDQQVELSTGGLGVGSLASQHADNFTVEKAVSLSSHCLQKNFSKMLHLWEKVINEVNLGDIDRFGTLVRMIATNTSNSVIHGGHRYAMLSAGANLNAYGAIKERWSGLSYVQFLNELAETQDLNPALENLSKLASILLNKNRLRVSVNVTPDNVQPTLAEMERFLSNVSGTASDYQTHPVGSDKFVSREDKLHHVFPFPVNYAAKAVSGVPYNHPDAGTLRVLGRLMFPFLHREIREKGGAYGGGASASPGGPFSFYSYRDPNSTKTFESFSASLDWVQSGEFSQREIDEAKLGVFQSLDAPVAPGSRGLRLFSSGITDQMFEKHRISVLEAKKEDIVRVAREQVLNAPHQGQCLIGPACEDTCDANGWRAVQH